MKPLSPKIAFFCLYSVHDQITDRHTIKISSNLTKLLQNWTKNYKANSQFSNDCKYSTYRKRDLSAMR